MKALLIVVLLIFSATCHSTTWAPSTVIAPISGNQCQVSNLYKRTLFLVSAIGALTTPQRPRRILHSRDQFNGSMMMVCFSLEVNT